MSANDRAEVLKRFYDPNAGIGARSNIGLIASHNKEVMEVVYDKLL